MDPSTLVDRCSHAGCGIKPFYGPAGGHAERCRIHKQDDDVRMYRSKCVVCGKRARYQTPEGRYCLGHKPRKGSIELRRTMCQGHGCTRRATHGPAGSMTVYCKYHKHDGCTEIRHRRWCSTTGCQNLATHWNPTDTQVFCSDHTQPGMPERSRRVCVIPSCTQTAIYGQPGGWVSRCMRHSPAHYTYPLFLNLELLPTPGQQPDVAAWLTL